MTMIIPSTIGTACVEKTVCNGGKYAAIADDNAISSSPLAYIQPVSLLDTRILRVLRCIALLPGNIYLAA